MEKCNFCGELVVSQPEDSSDCEDLKTEEKTFTLFWLYGNSELIHGESIADAMTKAGYGNGAIRALDFHSEGDKRDQYQWVTEKREGIRGESSFWKRV